MPVPTWEQVIDLLHTLGTCGVTLVLLVWHMLHEEDVRRQVQKALRERQRKEDE